MYIWISNLIPPEGSEWEVSLDMYLIVISQSSTGQWKVLVHFSGGSGAGVSVHHHGHICLQVCTHSTIDNSHSNHRDLLLGIFSYNYKCFTFAFTSSSHEKSICELALSCKKWSLFFVSALLYSIIVSLNHSPREHS